MIKHIYMLSDKKTDPRFYYSREWQEAVLNKIPEPEDNIERSFAQYQCQEKMMPTGKKIFTNIGGIVMLLNRFIVTPKKTPDFETCDLICMTEDMEKRIPGELFEEYKNVKITGGTENYLLKKIDLKWFFLKIVKKYFYRPFFCMKIFIRMTQYRYCLERYHPKAIAVTSEFSCSSSAMTDFCHINGVKHINYMHGEKIWFIRDSFFRYDKCYVWYEHYIKNFISLRAYPEQFAISIPSEFMERPNVSGMQVYDYCYYAQAESHESLDRIFEAFAVLAKTGQTVRIRCHPLWTDKAYVKKKATQNGITVETGELSINESILTCRHAVSLFSTVLLQSHILGVSIVVDDLTDPERFENLKKLDYIIFSISHSLLSKELEHYHG